MPTRKPNPRRDPWDGDYIETPRPSAAGLAFGGVVLTLILAGVLLAVGMGWV